MSENVTPHGHLTDEELDALAHEAFGPVVTATVTLHQLRAILRELRAHREREKNLHALVERPIMDRQRLAEQADVLHRMAASLAGKPSHARALDAVVSVLGELDYLRDRELRPKAPMVSMPATTAGALEVAEAFAAQQTDPTTRQHVENLAREVRRLRVELAARARARA